MDEEEFHSLEVSARKEGVPLHTKLVGLGPGLLALAQDRHHGSLLENIRSVLRDVDEGRTEAAWYPEWGHLLPLPLAGKTASSQAFSSVNAAADRAFREKAEKEERERLVARRKRELKRKVKRLKKKEERLAEELKEGEEEHPLRAAGQGLLAALGRVPRGAGSFELAGTEPGDSSRRVVSLDPALSPRENAQRFFRKAKKARLRSQAAGKRLPPVREEIAGLVRAVGAVEGLSLEELRKGAAGTGRGGKAAKAAVRGRKTLPAVREYRSGQWRILVGKSSRGNEYLTSKVALPEDLWFHVRDYPGAHAVLRSVRSPADPPEEIIRAAAEAAAFHSAARGESMVDVAFAFRKHVRKVKGQPPGKVQLTKSKTIRVRPRIPEGFRETQGSVVK
jgi:predicted ribosome quality control (RQC) complex YloA/Tae2 family protein